MENTYVIQADLGSDYSVNKLVRSVAFFKGHLNFKHKALGSAFADRVLLNIIREGLARMNVDFNERTVITAMDIQTSPDSPISITLTVSIIARFKITSVVELKPYDNNSTVKADGRSKSV